MTGTWPTSFATGDLMVAAEFKKGIGCISDTTLGGSAASVDISSIVGTYAHLIVVVYARGDAAVAAADFMMRFNGDTAAHYDYQNLQAFAASVGSTESFATATPLIGIVPGSTAGANLFGACVTFIPHYAGTANNKLALTVSAHKGGVASTQMINTLSGIYWRSNAAINRITVLPTSGNLVAGTRVSIYGMGA